MTASLLEETKLAYQLLDNALLLSKENIIGSFENIEERCNEVDEMIPNRDHVTIKQVDLYRRVGITVTHIYHLINKLFKRH